MAVAEMTKIEDSDCYDDDYDDDDDDYDDVDDDYDYDDSNYGGLYQYVKKKWRDRFLQIFFITLNMFTLDSNSNICENDITLVTCHVSVLLLLLLLLL